MRKQLAVARCDLTRQMLVADAQRAGESLSWVVTCAQTLRKAVPLLAVLSPLALGGAKKAGWKRLAAGGLVLWRMVPKLQPLWTRLSAFRRSNGQSPSDVSG